MTLPRRFYKSVAVSPGLGIALDGKLVKTAKKAVLTLPTPALAEAVAAEWDAQKTFINPSTMILTKLANTAIDLVAQQRPSVITEMVAYAGSDLVCYRAEQPMRLVERQNMHWDPVVKWAGETLGQTFSVYPGVIHQPQKEKALDVVRAELERWDKFELSAIHTIMSLAGSTLIALMLAKGGLSPDQAWVAGYVDEDFQAEQWGRDGEAEARQQRRRAEFLAACRFLTLACAD